jgi:hypothetical protein
LDWFAANIGLIASGGTGGALEVGAAGGFGACSRVENNALWFLKQPHCEAKGRGIYSV